jgi:hypothetical protein
MNASSIEVDQGSTKTEERLVIDTTPVLVHTALRQLGHSRALRSRSTGSVSRWRTTGAGAIEVLIPEKAVSMDDVARDPAQLQADPLGRFADLVARNLLRQGVTLTSSPNVKAGIKVRLTDKGVDLDLSDQAIADVLLQHLQPRFRALLEGIV